MQLKIYIFLIGLVFIPLSVVFANDLGISRRTSLIKPYFETVATNTSQLLFAPDTDLGADLGQPYLRFNQGHIGYVSSTAISAPTICFGSNCQTSFGGDFAWTPTLHFGENTNATTTALWINENLYVSSSAYFSDINASGILPTGNNTFDIGAYGTAWKNLYVSSTAYLNYVSSTAMDVGTILSGDWNGNVIGDAYITKTGAWTGTFDGQEGSYYLNAINLNNFGTPFYTFFSATNTTALSEGTNLYWTNDRFDIRLSTTSTLPNLTTLAGLSITESQISDLDHFDGGDFYTYFSATNTDALSEGSNLYWTNDRFDTRLSASSSIDGIVTLSNLFITESQISDLVHYTDLDWDSHWNASSTLASVTTIPNLSITESQISDLAHYTNADWDTHWATSNTLDSVTSIPNLDTVGTLTTAGGAISLWTNDSNYITQAIASTTFVDRADWTSIDDYPTGCSGGQVVSAIGDTLTCISTSTNADTATALGANGGNCNAGEYNLGVDEFGAVENCTDATTEIDSAISTHASDDDAHHALVTLAGQDYLTLSTQQITAGVIEPDDLGSSDFGDFTCDGATCVLDANYLLQSEYFTTTTHFTMATLPALTSYGTTGVTTTATGDLSITGNLNVGGSSVSSTFANGIVLTGGCFEIGGSCLTSGSSGATTELDNLGTVAINTSLLSDTNNTDDLGAYGSAWKNIYASSTAYLDYVSSTAITLANGSFSAPSYSFTSDSDTGMYRYGINGLGFVGGGSYKLLLGANISAYTNIISASNNADNLGGFGNAWENLFVSSTSFLNYVSSTQFEGALVGNASTATELASNGANCNSGNSPLGVDEFGASEDCFDVWTESENTAAAYISGNETITLSGDATGSGTTALTITLSNGAVDSYDLATSSAFSDQDFILWDSAGTFSPTTTISQDRIDSLIARDSELHALVTLAGSPNYLTLAGQEITMTVLDFSDDTNATVTSPITLTDDDIGFDFSTANTWTGLNTFSYVSSTALSSPYVSSTLYYGSGLQTCNATTGKLVWTNGQFTCGTDTSAAGADPFSWSSHFGDIYAVTSSMWLTNLAVSSTAYLDYVSSTAMDISGYLTVGGTITGDVTGNLTGNADTVDSDSTWTKHNDYPNACVAGGGVVTGIGDTLTCTATSTLGLVTIGGAFHDGFSDYVANEHLDWTASVGTIHTDNYVEGHGNGANCGVGEYPLGVDASGAVEDCTDATTEITSLVATAFAWTPATTYNENTNSTSTPIWLKDTLYASSTSFFTGASVFLGGITGTLTGNADTATASADNPTNCAAGSYPLGVDANWDVESCTDATTEIDSAISTHAGDDDAHQPLVTLTGQNYLTLSTQQITAGVIEPDDLGSSDFGDFTCNGTTCLLDASYLLQSEYFTSTTHFSMATLPALTSYGTAGVTTTASGDLSITGNLNVGGSTASSTFANGIVLTGGCFEVGGSCLTSGSSGANTALSNLASVAINESLISDTANTDDLGSFTLPWNDIFASGTIYGTLSGTAVPDSISFSSTTYDGIVTYDGYTGYYAADLICNDATTGSHFCSSGEVGSYLTAYTSSTVSAVTAWTKEYAPGYTANANDCNAFTDNTSTYLGAFLDNTGATTPESESYWLVSCAVQKKLTCCI